MTLPALKQEPVTDDDSDLANQNASLHRILYRVRPALLGDFLKRIFGIKRQVAKTSRGLRFLVDPVSQFGRTIMDHGVYEPAITEVLDTLLRPNDTFVDLGGNEGYFSVLAGSLMSKRGKVLWVEPQSTLLPIFDQNVALNKLNNIRIHQVALADRKGEITLHLPTNSNSGAGTILGTKAFGGSSQTVPLTTLDSLLKENAIEKVRLIKIDCEGAEESILKGAKSTLKRKAIEFWIIDYHGHMVGLEAVARIDELMRNHGYQLFELRNGSWIYCLPTSKGKLKVIGVDREVGKEFCSNRSTNR